VCVGLLTKAMSYPKRTECHNSLANLILSEEEFSREETDEILGRHNEVRNLCVKSEHIGTFGPATALIIHPLRGCAGKSH